MITNDDITAHQEEHCITARASLVPNIREVTVLIAASALLAIPLSCDAQTSDQPTQAPTSTSQVGQ